MGKGRGALRGSAFDLFNLATGLAILIASFFAGLLWEGIGPTSTFIADAGYATIALIGLFSIGRGFAATSRE